MRILVVNWQDRDNPQAGGAELHLHEIFGRIARLGNTVDLLCSGWPGVPSRTNRDGIEIHRVGGRYTFQFFAHRYYRRYLSGNSYDVVIEDLNKLPLYLSRWGARRVVALVHHLFGTTAFREAPVPMALIVWLMERPLARMYRGVPFEAVSQSTADDLVTRGIPRELIRVIYNGVDVNFLTPAPEERSSQPLFVYLGRLKKYKRIDLLIRAFGLIKNQQARLEIAGTGDAMRSLRSTVERMGLGDRVRFRGRITEEEKLHLLRSAWALLLASPKEGWGISNLEAAACGTPVIAADAPGVRESVVDGETGFLVRDASPAAFAASMQQFLSDPSLVDSMGNSARQFALRFTWDRAARETLDHLQSVVGGAKSGATSTSGR